MGNPQRLNPAVGVVLVAVAVLAAACSDGSKQTIPQPSSARPSAAVPSETNKAVISMPPRAFNPSGSAADGILALESQGYNVVVQNTGDSAIPLSSCRISAVDGLRGNTPPANTTVYLTVSC